MANKGFCVSHIIYKYDCDNYHKSSSVR